MLDTFGPALYGVPEAPAKGPERRSGRLNSCGPLTQPLLVGRQWFSRVDGRRRESLEDLCGKDLMLRHRLPDKCLKVLASVPVMRQQQPVPARRDVVADLAKSTWLRQVHLRPSSGDALVCDRSSWRSNNHGRECGDADSTIFGKLSQLRVRLPDVSKAHFA